MSEQLKDKKEHKPLDPVDFVLKKDGIEKTYRYHYELNTVRQVEPAIAVVEHYFNSNEAAQTKLSQQMLSGYHQYVTETMKYLVREVINGVVQEYKHNLKDTVAEDLRDLPLDQYDKLYECVMDFFYAINRKDIASRMRLSKKKMSLEGLTTMISSLRKNVTSSEKKPSTQRKLTQRSTKTKAPVAKPKP